VVDTGATNLRLPKRYIRKLGLRPLGHTEPVNTAVGVVESKLYAGAMLTIEDRTEVFSVLELPDTAPALIGVLVLEALDYMVDPTTEKLVGKHGEKRVILLY
jgi:predicted aspartyl protease